MVAVLFGLTASLCRAEDPPIVIGAVFTLTGNVAQYGVWATRGVTMAADETLQAGGIAGRRLRLIFEDSAGQAGKAISAYQKLRSVDKVNFVLTQLSSVALAVEPFAERDHVVQMEISATAPGYGTPDGFAFRTGVNAAQLASYAAEELLKLPDGQAAACLYIENEFGQGMYNVFRSSYRGKMPVTETFRPEDGDFRPQLLRIKSSGVKVVWLVGHVRESGLILAQARQLGINAQFFSDVYSLDGPEFLAAAGAAAEGVLYAVPRFEVSSAAEVVQRFVTRYRKVYGEEPTVYEAQAYDAILALTSAMKMCAKLSTECVRDKLRTLDFAGASGRIRFDQRGNVLKEIELKTVRLGRFAVKTER